MEKINEAKNHTRKALTWAKRMAPLPGCEGMN